MLNLSSIYEYGFSYKHEIAPNTSAGKTMLKIAGKKKYIVPNEDFEKIIRYIRNGEKMVSRK